MALQLFQDRMVWVGQRQPLSDSGFDVDRCANVAGQAMQARQMKVEVQAYPPQRRRYRDRLEIIVAAYGQLVDRVVDSPQALHPVGERLAAPPIARIVVATGELHAPLEVGDGGGKITREER